MNVLHFTDEEKQKIPESPAGWRGRVHPIPAKDGGWYFAPDKKSLLDSLSVVYNEVDLDTVKRVIIPTDVCMRCEEQYPEGEITDARGFCKFCVAAEDKEKKKIARQARVDFLKEESVGTPIEEHVSTLLDHYAKETHQYIESGSTALADAINNETDETILALLAIVLVEDWNYTVKQSILTRISI